MSEVEPVQVVRDTGYKAGWHFQKFLYRQDGKKLTLEGRIVMGVVAASFVVSSAFILIRGPTEMEVRSPIIFGGLVTPVSTIDIPMAAAGSHSTEIQQRYRNSPRSFSGLQVIGRPKLGEIPPGTITRARLESGASNGLVKASLIETLVVNGDSVAEPGTVLVGNGTSTEERLNIAFSKMVFRDGKVQTIKAQACDSEDKTVGIRGAKVSRFASMFAASVGLNFVGGLADGLQESQVQNGVAVRKSDLRNAALNGAARASIDQSKDMMEKWKQEKTIIEVKKDTEICIIFDGE
jgi:hypothetical protein